MSTTYGDIFNALARPFEGGDVRERDGGQGRKLSYITPRTAANRLDEVLGWENWDCDVFPVSDHAYKCVLSVTLPDGRRVTKAAVGAKSTMSQKAGGKVDPGDDDKGGDSDAFKRAASLFGVGRYLHNDGVMHYGDTRDDGLPTGGSPKAPRAAPSGEDTRTKGVKLAEWARRNGHEGRANALAKSNYACEVSELGDEAADVVYGLLKAIKPLAEVPQPPARTPPPAQAQSPGARNENGNPVDFGWPRSGAAMYAWTKNLEGAFHVSLVKAVDGEFCKPGGWGREWKSWTPEQVGQAAVFVAKRVRDLPGYDGQFDAHIPDTLTLKGEIAAAATALLKATGVAEPTKVEIDRLILATVADLERGWDGETLGDFEACEDAGRLGEVLAQIRSDVEDSGIPW